MHSSISRSFGKLIIVVGVLVICALIGIAFQAITEPPLGYIVAAACAIVIFTLLLKRPKQSSDESAQINGSTTDDADEDTATYIDRLVDDPDQHYRGVHPSDLPVDATSQTRTQNWPPSTGGHVSGKFSAKPAHYKKGMSIDYVFAMAIKPLLLIIVLLLIAGLWTVVFFVNYSWTLQIRPYGEDLYVPGLAVIAIFLLITSAPVYKHRWIQTHRITEVIGDRVKISLKRNRWLGVTAQNNDKNVTVFFGAEIFKKHWIQHWGFWRAGKSGHVLLSTILDAQGRTSTDGEMSPTDLMIEFAKNPEDLREAVMFNADLFRSKQGGLM